MKGYVKLYRELLEDPVVCKDNDHFRVWIYLLLHAAHKECAAMFKCKKITLQPGQLITGRKALSKECGISESKVQRILKTFENEHQIEQQTGTKNRLITITEWAEYQNSEHQNEQQVNNKRTTNEQQMNTNKNEKNDKNEKNEKKYTLSSDDASASAEIQAVFEQYNSICKSLPNAKRLTNDRKRHIKARLCSYSAEQLEKAFIMSEQSDFMTGRCGKWRASLDWLIANDRNILKVLEGNYVNKSSEAADPAQSYACLAPSGDISEIERMFMSSYN